VRDTLAAAPSWDSATLEAELRGLAEQRGIGGGKLFQPLRVALTGLTVSPGIFDVLILQGRDQSLKRIEHAIQYLDGPIDG
jgi:glutamyl-tRNA synthetase